MPNNQSLNQSNRPGTQNPETIFTFLDSLRDKEPHENDLEILCELILHKDKGIRNYAAAILISNPVESTAQKIVKLISADDLTIKNLAGDILLNLKEKSVPALLQNLNTDNDDDIKFIVDILGLIGDQSSEDRIIEILNLNTNENVVLACIEALGNLRSEKSIDYMINLFPLNEHYQATIIESLGKIGNQYSLEFILSKYDTEDELIKFSVIEALGKIGNEESFFFLLGEMSQANAFLTGAILDSVYNLKDKFGFDIPFDERMKNRILSILQEKNNPYKKKAAHLLTEFDDPEIFVVYMKTIGSDPELDEIILHKLYSMPEAVIPLIPQLVTTEMGNPQYLFGVLRDLLNSERLNSVYNAEPFEKRGILDALIPFITSSDEELRITTFEMLLKIDTETALLFSDEIIDDPNMWNRIKLIELLEPVEHEQKYIMLQRLAKDEEDMVKMKAEALLRLKPVINDK